MFGQCISYYTVGWDALNNIVTIPVLKRKRIINRDGRLIPLYFEDTIVDAAKERSCVVCLLDNKLFQLDDYGNREINTNWRVCENIVKADDLFAARLAIDFVESRFRRAG
jgi:hypothetical protein